MGVTTQEVGTEPVQSDTRSFPPVDPDPTSARTDESEDVAGEETQEGQ